MRCLVVGGTGFLGGAITEALHGAGHAVAVLSRGLGARVLPEGVEAIAADRHGDLGALDGRAFDWVFDTCAYAPDAVARLLGAVGGDLERYVLISSISVYGSYENAGLDETAPAPDATEEDRAVAASVRAQERSDAAAYGASYGPLKRACERAAEDALGARACALRVGLLVGAGDYTDRLTWWVRRLDEAAGARAEVPVPAPMDRAVQMIDVRDAAAFAALCAEEGLAGAWNVTGRPMPLGALLSEVAALSGSEARLVPVPEEAFAAEGVQPWTEVPLMASPLPQFRHFLSVGTGRAEAAGLTCRPPRETLEPLLAWDRGRRDAALGCGMTEEQEARVLRRARDG